MKALDIGSAHNKC